MANEFIHPVRRRTAAAHPSVAIECRTLSFAEHTALESGLDAAFRVIAICIIMSFATDAGVADRVVPTITTIEGDVIGSSVARQKFPVNGFLESS